MTPDNRSLLHQARVLLFDLDGTLLPMNMEAFLQRYTRLLAAAVAPVIESRRFIAALWSATAAMIENDNPQCSNETVFWHAFTAATRLNRDAIEPLIDQFYHLQFDQLAELTCPSELAPRIVEQAVEQGKIIVLATNPVFPAIATRARMRWAGIADFPWQLITTYENSRYCKPKPGYYGDILTALACTPEECVMIGNDATEDLAAGILGIPTFIVLDCLIARPESSFRPTAQGTLADLWQVMTGPPPR